MIQNIISEQSIDNARQAILNSEKIIIVAHTSPDGDAVGSVMGMHRFLCNMGKKPVAIFPDDFPSFLKNVPFVSEALLHRDNEHISEINAAIADADLILCQDFNEFKRTASMSDALSKSSAKKILIDHHLDPTPDCWDVVISFPEMSSTCELVYRLISQMGYGNMIDTVCAECLYTGMMTDTGNFTYSSSNPEFYHIIAELLRKGVDKDKIYRDVNRNSSVDRMKLWGYLLSEKMIVYPEYKTAVTVLTSAEKTKFNFQKGDTEGFVNEPLMIKGIVFSAFFSEDKGKIKLSFRSIGSFPTNVVASKHFGGGGHLNASGGESYTTLEKTVKKFVDDVLPLYKELLNKK